MPTIRSTILNKASTRLIKNHVWQAMERTRSAVEREPQKPYSEAWHVMDNLMQIAQHVDECRDLGMTAEDTENHLLSLFDDNVLDLKC